MATYYVSETATNGYAVGNNGNACTAKGAPCLTINGGAGKMSGGDTLIINDGEYTENLLNIFPAGTNFTSGATNVQAENTGAVLVKPGSGTFAMTILAVTKRYIIFDGLVFDGTNLTGSGNIVKLEGNDPLGFPNFIRFTECTFQNYTVSLQSGLQLPSWGFTLIGEDLGGRNEILNCLFDNIGNGNSAAIYIQNDHNVVEGCEFVDIHFCGVTLNKQNASFPDDNIVRKNRFHQIAGQPVVIAGGFRNLIVNNLMYDNTTNAAGGGGVRMVSGGDDNLIYHNTFYDMTGNAVDITDSNFNDTIVRNNLGFSLSGGMLSDSGTGTVASNNTETDPTFTDAANGDFHISSGSAAEGAGTSLAGAVPTDFDGETFANPPSIGAYEVVGEDEPYPPLILTRAA